MNAASKSPIDVSKIRIEFPDAGKYDERDPLFLDELSLLREELSAPDAIRIICIHETGHLTYFREMGKPLNISPDKFRFVRPSVTYGPNKKQEYQFDHFVSAVETPFRKTDLDYINETLINLARACFAGAVFIDELAKGALNGSLIDRRMFHCYYNQAIRQQLGQLDFLESQLEAQAIAKVTRDLQDPANKTAALANAEELEDKYFRT